MTSTLVNEMDEGYDGQRREKEDLPYPSFSESIDTIGLGRYQLVLLCICGMGLVIDAMEVLVIAFILDDVAVRFDLGDVAKGLLGSASFLGMLVGAIFWSVQADRSGRRSAFIQSMAFVFVCGVCSALAPSYLSLLAFRTLVGFGVGGSIPVANALLAEFLPTKDRATYISYLGFFWGLGMLAVPLLGMILSNTVGSGDSSFPTWRCFLLLAALPSLILTLAYFVLPESPRYLAVMGRHQEAAAILEDVAWTNRGSRSFLKLTSGQENGGQCEPSPNNATDSSMHFQAGWSQEGRINNLNYNSSSSGDLATNSKGNDVEVGDRLMVAPTGSGQEQEVTIEEGEGCQDWTGDVRELFHTLNLQRVTFNIWGLWFFSNLSYYGILFMLPTYYKRFESWNGGIYLYATLGNIMFFPGVLMGMWLCSERRLGRVWALWWTSLVSGLIFFVLAISYSSPTLFLVSSFISITCVGIPGALKYIITPEIYTTRHRATAMGSASAWTRIAGFLAPLISEVMYTRLGPGSPLILYGCSMILSAVCSVQLLPFETAGHQLDNNQL